MIICAILGRSSSTPSGNWFVGFALQEAATILNVVSEFMLTDGVHWLGWLLAISFVIYALACAVRSLWPPAPAKPTRVQVVMALTSDGDYRLLEYTELPASELPIGEQAKTEPPR